MKWNEKLNKKLQRCKATLNMLLIRELDAKVDNNSGYSNEGLKQSASFYLPTSTNQCTNEIT
jgi:hypothetical protein